MAYLFAAIAMTLSVFKGHYSIASFVLYLFSNAIFLIMNSVVTMLSYNVRHAVPLQQLKLIFF